MSNTTLKGSGNPLKHLVKRELLIIGLGASLGVCISHELPGKGPMELVPECTLRSDALAPQALVQEARMSLGREAQRSLNSPSIMLSKQYNLPFILSMKNLKREQKREAVLKDECKEGCQGHAFFVRKEAQGKELGPSEQENPPLVSECDLLWEANGI